MSSFVVPSKVSGDAPLISAVTVNASVAALPIVVSPFRFAAPDNVVVPETVAVERVILPLPKAIVGSVPPDASKVQVIGVPAPKVVVDISVVSRSIVTVSVAVTSVSIPVVPPATSRVLPDVIVSVVASSPSRVKRVVEVVRQVEQPMSPAAERVIGVVAETATVPDAFGKVIVLLLDVGSVIAKMV